MKTTNRILSLLLAALMLLPILTGCGGSAENPPEPPAGTAQSPASEAPAPETDPPVTEPTEYENPGKNYQGETFTVAAVDYYAQGGEPVVPLADSLEVMRLIELARAEPVVSPA